MYFVGTLISWFESIMEKIDGKWYPMNISSFTVVDNFLVNDHFIYHFWLMLFFVLLLEYVKIAIPWSNLLGTSTEVTLELSGLYIIAGPVADRPYDKKKDEKLNNAIKQAKLQSFEESAYQKVG